LEPAQPAFCGILPTAKIAENPDQNLSFNPFKVYNLNPLIYCETFNQKAEAIAQEKQLKGGSRKKKENLIYTFNPHWIDLDDAR
jgi:predicted GIY-YIG superfamily endonuclease